MLGWRSWPPVLVSTERQHHVLLVRGALLQSRVVGLDPGQLRPLDVERVPAVDEGAERNVAHAEALSADVVAALEALLEHLERLRGLVDAVVDRLAVALLGRRADQAPEHRRERRRDGARR